MQRSRVRFRLLVTGCSVLAGVGVVGVHAAPVPVAAAPFPDEIGRGGAAASAVAVRLTPPVVTSPPGDSVLPTSGTWTNVTANLAGLASECGNLTMLSSVPGQDVLIAGVARRGLWRTTDGGASWSPLGTGPGSAVIDNRPSSIAYDPAAPSTFWESGIYGDGVYRTTDGGSTFQRLGSIGHIDQVSVDFTDPLRRTLVAGGHEASRTVHRSTDGGATWTNIGANLPAGTGFSSNPIVLGPNTYLVNTSAGWGGTPGIYRTTDGGASWSKVSALGPSGPAVVTPGLIAWRVGDQLAVSTNQGQTWSSVGSGLTVDPTQLPNGNLLSATSSHVVVSADGGNTWSDVGPTQPSPPQGIAYLPTRHAVFISRWDCNGAVLPDAIQRLQ